MVSLKDQLAEIADATPKDFDPEDSYATYRNSASASAAKEAARADYVEVGKSQLRKKGEAEVDAKYAGRKASRKELFDMGGDQESESEGGEDAEDDDVEDEEDDYSEQGDEEEEEAMPAPPAPKAKATSKAERVKEREQLSMVQQLRKAASADVDKGRDVKKQLAFTDNLLEARIKMQKPLTNVNALPQATSAEDFYSQLPEEVQATMKAVHELNEDLFEFRIELLNNNESLSAPPATRKRPRSTSDPAASDAYLLSSLKDLTALEALLNPFLKQTITKWSDKVLAASSLTASSNSKKFKAVAQTSPLAQIEGLMKNELDRLVGRTRVGRVEGAAAPKALGREEKPESMELDVPEEEEGGKRKKAKREEDKEVFDDGDFYAELLREIVESRMMDLDDPTLKGLRLSSMRAKKQKNIVDTRASKGRKIRYHVHEKLQNFMIPIQAVGWHDEQIDELFASLLGANAASSSAVKEEGVKASSGLRIF